PVRVEVAPARQRMLAYCSYALLAVGVAASAAAWTWLPFHFGPGLLVVGPLLVLGFVLVEQLTINVDVRGFGWAISFTEIPLILGMLTVPFGIVLAANLLAGL